MHTPLATFAARRASALLLALLASAACTSATQTAGSRPSGSTPSPSGSGATVPATRTSDAAEDAFIRTNAARRANGLSALARSVNLMTAAQIQADQMAQTGIMEHEIESARYPTLKSRLAAVSYDMRAAGENIAAGQRTAAEALDTWMNSSGHRSNILSREYTELGTGVAVGRNGRLYWVQVFGRPAHTAARTNPGD